MADEGWQPQAYKPPLHRAADDDSTLWQSAPISTYFGLVFFFYTTKPWQNAAGLDASWPAWGNFGFLCMAFWDELAAAQADSRLSQTLPSLASNTARPVSKRASTRRLHRMAWRSKLGAHTSVFHVSSVHFLHVPSLLQMH